MNGIAHAASEFPSAGGRTLYRRSWCPLDRVRGAVIIVHGYAEHSGRYEWVGNELAGAGFAAHAFDLRGHGRSEGKRTLVKSFREHLDDVARFQRMVAGEEEGVPLFLLGHSMGGGIAALYAAVRQPALRGLILSGPALPQEGVRPGIVERLVAGIGRIAPGLPLRAFPAAEISRDPQVVADYDADPLVYRGKVLAGMVSSMRRARARIDQDMERITLPLLVIHGTADSLCPVEASEALLRRVGSTDKTLKAYEGLFHEVLNEPEKAQVMADVLAWLRDRS